LRYRRDRKRKLAVQSRDDDHAQPGLAPVSATPTRPDGAIAYRQNPSPERASCPKISKTKFSLPS
jgi:hypothetical protein